MPLDPEFLRHLHDVMVEVSETLAESEATYKSELIWKAQKTNNAAALPIAYKDAALHAIKTRFDQTVERYLQALVQWDGLIDDAVEKEMKQHINLLTSGPNILHFPPALPVTSIEAVQQSYAMERQRLIHQLQLGAANRLRELKMQAKQMPQSSNPTIHNHFHAPVQTAYINSVHNSGTNIEITLQNLDEIDSISAGHPQLEEAARDLRTAYPQRASTLEKAQRWVTLVGSIDGLTEKAIQYSPQIAALFHRFITP